mgnify:CR=1 FL=1
MRLGIFALSSRAATSQIGYRWYPVKLFNFDAKHKEKLRIKNKEVISILFFFIIREDSICVEIDLT